MQLKFGKEKELFHEEKEINIPTWLGKTIIIITFLIVFIVILYFVIKG